ncbi:MAG TPA: hypothetical protein VFN97_26185 [Actinospica sp.]|nr:hypothetical protein [Actinospica sp.]
MITRTDAHTDIDAVLTAEDRTTLQNAVHGALALMIAANGGPIAATRAGIAGGKAVHTATGLIGRVVTAKPADLNVGGKSVGEMADKVFPAITGSARLLAEKVPAEVENLRATIDMVIDAVQRSHRGAALPTEVEMARKIRLALDAA